jgi:cell division protein FtsB
MATRATSREKPGRVLIRRLAWGAGVVAVLAFAVEGGEYGTSDLLAQREKKAALADTLEQLRDSVAILAREVKLVTSDPARLEHLAREEYGMVKGDKELLYWTVGAAQQTAADSVRAASDSVRR